MKIELYSLARSLIKRLQHEHRRWKQKALSLDRENDRLHTENTDLKYRLARLQNVTVERVIWDATQPLEIRWRITDVVLKYHRNPESVFEDAMKQMWEQLRHYRL